MRGRAKAQPATARAEAGTGVQPGRKRGKTSARAAIQRPRLVQVELDAPEPDENWLITPEQMHEEVEALRRQLYPDSRRLDA